MVSVVYISNTGEVWTSKKYLIQYLNHNDYASTKEYLIYLVYET